MRGIVDEWVLGDVRSSVLVREATYGVDRVISALGVTRQKADPWDIDFRVNRGLLYSALEHGVAAFCYVNVLGGDQCPAELTRAKAAFARELKSSDMLGQIINPPGFFSDMSQVLTMAKHGRAYLLGPEVKINPIHGADLAAFCVDRVEEGLDGVWDVGGPETFTWQELAEVAFATIDRPTRMTKVSPALARAAIRIVGLINKRTADTMTFVTFGMLNDSVGEPTGSNRLRDFFDQYADQ